MELEEELRNEKNRKESLDNLKLRLISEPSSLTFASETIKMNGSLSLSNLNRTVEKLGSSCLFYGIRCSDNALIKSFEKMTFSIKIDKKQDAHLMFGFCLKTSDSSVKNEYYATEF